MTTVCGDVNEGSGRVYLGGIRNGMTTHGKSGIFQGSHIEPWIY